MSQETRVWSGQRTQTGPSGWTSHGIAERSYVDLECAPLLRRRVSTCSTPRTCLYSPTSESSTARECRRPPYRPVAGGAPYRTFGGVVMTRTVGFVCCASLLAFPSMLASTGQKPAPESTPVTRTATIEAIDKANRTVTLKGPTGNREEIKAPEQMEGFNSLRVGDQVTATYYTAIAVNYASPATRAPGGPDDDDATKRPHTGIRNAEGADVQGDRRSHRPEGAISHREGATGRCRPARAAGCDADPECQNRGHGRCHLLRGAAIKWIVRRNSATRGERAAGNLDVLGVSPLRRAAAPFLFPVSLFSCSSPTP